MASLNQAPKLKWYSEILACGTTRQFLFLDGQQTPFFIDSARYHAHRSLGQVHGLWGSGMGALIAEAKKPYRIAAPLGCGPKIEPLKHRAEQMAMLRITT